MKKNKQPRIVLKGKNEQLKINADDEVAMKLAMLIEGTLYDYTKKEIAERYGYTREHYYHVKEQFEQFGSIGLQDKKPGPKKNSKRTNVANNQIIRLRFLDPEASPQVIGQKMRQMGFNISDRSVSRTIEEYGLQKKTPHVRPEERHGKRTKSLCNQGKDKNNKSNSIEK